MKSFNILFVTIIVADIGYSFVGKSNFDSKEQQTLSASEYADTISVEDMKKLTTLLEKELLESIRSTLEEKDPHVFMTKCYSKVSFDVKSKGDGLGLFDRGLIEGQIIFVNCSEAITITNFVADLKENKVHLWESYRRPKVSTTDFLAEFKAYVNEHGVPGN